MLVRRFVFIPLALAALACGSQVSSSVTDDSTDEEVGIQPEDPEAVYSACGSPDACSPLPYCVFPSGETGYCTRECVSPDDPTGCPDDPGGLGRAFCLDIGLPSGARVCGISCEDGLPCPEGMRCEQVETDDGPTSACF